MPRCSIESVENRPIRLSIHLEKSSAFENFEKILDPWDNASMSTLTPSPTVGKYSNLDFNLWDDCQESKSDSYNNDIFPSRPNPIEEAKETDEADYISALGFNYGPTLTTFISDGNLRNLYSLKRHSEESLSLFRNEVNAPVSIIICPAPDDDQSTYRTSPTSSAFSLPTISTDDLPDATHLMPPSGELLQAIRRKSKEDQHLEVKTWLISSLNQRGDKILPRVRKRIMDIYGITEADFLSEMTAKLRSFPTSASAEEDLPADVQNKLDKLEGNLSKEDAILLLDACFYLPIPSSSLPPTSTPKSIPSA